MKGKEEELLELFDYIEKKKKQIMQELEPYFEKLDCRLESHMNTYGIASPKDNCLLRDLEAIFNVENKLKVTKDIKRLKEDLENGMHDEREARKSTTLKKEIEFLTEYERLQSENISNKTL